MPPVDAAERVRRRTLPARWVQPQLIALDVYLIGWYVSCWSFWYIDNRRHTALVLVGIAVVVLAPKRAVSTAKISLAIVPLLVWILLSRFWTANPSAFAAVFMKSIVDAPVVMLVAATVPWERLVQRLLLWFYAGMAFTWLWSLTHFEARVSDLAGRSWSWHGSFVHKNVMLVFLMFGLALVQAYEHRHGHRRAAQASIVALVLLSHSTTGLATLAVVAVLVVWLRRFQAERVSRRGAFLLLSVLAGSILVTIGILSIPFFAQTAGKDTTFSGRTEIWAASWRAIHREPFTGYGLGGVFSGRDLPPTQQMIREIGFDAAHAHNGALDLLLQLGYVGLALWLVFAVPLVARGWTLVKRHNPMGTFVVIGIGAQLFISISEPVLLLGMFSMMALMHPPALRMVSAAPVDAHPTGRAR